MSSRLFQVLSDALFPPRDTERAVRALAARGPDALAPFMQPICIETGGTQVPAVTLLPYAEPSVSACVREAKFSGSVPAAALLGAALRDFLFEYLAERSAWDAGPPCIVPLPLSPSRRKERGYNQAERIVRAGFGEDSTLAVIDPEVLVRTRATLPQTSLRASERRKNVAGAFVAPNPCDPYRTYIVIDDVCTTGSTLAAAVAALRHAGAQHILPLALAH